MHPSTKWEVLGHYHPRLQQVEMFQRFSMVLLQLIGINCPPHAVKYSTSIIDDDLDNLVKNIDEVLCVYDPINALFTRNCCQLWRTKGDDCASAKGLPTITFAQAGWFSTS